MAGFLARLASVFKAHTPYTTTGFGPRSVALRAPAYGPNTALDYSLTGLRNLSRDQVRKNALAGSAVERVVSNVVGTGIKPKIADETMAKLWRAWTDQSAADGQLDFYGQQQQIMRAVVESGECFVRLRNRLPVDGLAVPLQIEVLEPEFIPVQWNLAADSGGEIRQGIEFDPVLRSKRVAYWVYPRHPNDAGVVQVDMFPVRVPASEILHIYWPGRPGQVRGEPWLARVLDKLNDLDTYTKAELTRKGLAALFVGFIRRAMPQNLELDDLVQMYGEGDPNDPIATQIQNGQGVVTASAGTFQVLKPGEDVEFPTVPDVGTSYDPFIRSHQRDIAAGIGILFEQLTGDYSTGNDRTWRAAVTEFRRRCEGWQHHLLVYQLCRPVMTRWLDMAIVSGAASVARAAELAGVEWTPQAWPYINPLQDVQAREAEVRAGFTSRTAVVSERGEDAATVDAEQAADNERADAAGVSYTSDGRNPTNGPTQTVETAAAQAAQEAAAESAKAKQAAGNAQAAQLDLFTAFLAHKPKPAPAPEIIVQIPERLVVDAVKAQPATRAVIETKDDDGRILTMLIEPVSGSGPRFRRTVDYDPATGRMTGHQDELING
ncbi:MAG: phage portal protein [Alsobacter sp.]